jgi:predicted kinase
LVNAGEPVEAELWRLAHLLATFHARATRSAAADEAAGVVATRARWRANTEALVRLRSVRTLGPGVEVIQGLADRYLDGRGPLLQHRIAIGAAVDGHGDLLADDIFCLDDGPRVLDCIEFDDHLRMGDRLADVAFLAMDLERLGRPDLAEHFLRAYREHSAAHWPSSLAHHQVAYRAQVRAKVTAIRAEQGDEDAAFEASRLLQLANAHLEAGRVRLVLVGGLPGTGKSTVAAAISETLDATVLRSDEVRKEQAGIPLDQPAPAAFRSGLYTDAATDATYEALLERARVALGMGESVVVDASWGSSQWRARARVVAEAAHADLDELRCAAPAAVTGPRLAARAAEGQDPSDATADIAAAMEAVASAWPEAALLDTARPLDQTLAAARAAVEQPLNPFPLA